MRLRLTLLGAFLVPLVVAGASLAAPPPTRAQELFREGRQLMTRGDVVRACQAFAESNALDPETGTLLNLALCHQELGDDRSALAEFRAAALNAERHQEKDRASFARQRAVELQKKLAEAVASGSTPSSPSASAPPAQEVKPTEPAAPASPGSGTSASPAQPHAEPPTPGNAAPPPALAEPAAHGQPTVVVASGTPGPGDRAAGSGGVLRALGWSAAGAGVVSVGLASYFGLHASSENHWDKSPNCQTQVGVIYCNSTGLDERSQALQSAGISTALFVVGGVLVAGGTTLALVAPKGGVQVIPAVGRGGAGLAAMGSFE